MMTDQIVEPPVAGPEGRKNWVDEEVLASEFRDKRLATRFKMILKQLSEATEEYIPGHGWTLGLAEIKLWRARSSRGPAQ